MSATHYLQILNVYKRLLSKQTVCAFTSVEVLLMVLMGFPQVFFVL